MKRFTSVEQRIDSAAHGVLDRLPAHGLSGALVEFLVFGLKQAWACLFGGAMLFLIIATKYLPPDGLGLARYDFLFLAALAIQLSMLALPAGNSSGSQGHPDLPRRRHGDGDLQDLRRLVDLSGGQLLPHRRRAAVFGLHVCRCRLLSRPHLAHLRHALHGLSAAMGHSAARRRDLRRISSPTISSLDMRYVLFAATALLYLSTTVHYRVFRFRHRMPLLLGFLLVALFIWFAENIGTWSRAWLYPGSGRGLDAGLDPEARRLVSADDHLVRAGDAGSPAAAARRSTRRPAIAVKPCDCRA